MVVPPPGRGVVQGTAGPGWVVGRALTVRDIAFYMREIDVPTHSTKLTRAVHAHPLHSAALAFVSYGTLLVRDRVAGRCWRGMELPAPRARCAMCRRLTSGSPWCRPLVSVEWPAEGGRGLVTGFWQAPLCGPFGLGGRETIVFEVAFEGPDKCHLLAAGDALCPHPRRQKPPGKVAHGHARDVSSPGKRAAREVMLKLEHLGALLWAFGSGAVDERPAHGNPGHLSGSLVVPEAESQDIRRCNHHDTQPWNSTASTPTAYTSPLSRPGTPEA